MKISLCSIAFRKSGLPLSEIIKRTAAMGYDGLEVWGNHLVGLDLTEAMGLLRHHGLAVSMVAPYFDFTGGSRNMYRSLEAAAQSIEIAERLGAPLIRTFTGVVGSDEASPDQFSACAASLKKVCRLAADKGVSFALETHPKTLVDSVPATLRLLDAVNEPNLKVNLDIYHMWEVHFDPLWVLDRLFGGVAHVHAKNAVIPPQSEYPLLHDRQASQEIMGVTPLAKGNMPYDAFLQALAEKEFKGFISVEWFGPDVENMARGELAYLRARFSAAANQPLDLLR